MRLKNKVVIVTGGAAGIGAAIVARFAREGAAVVIADPNEEGGRQVTESCRGCPNQVLAISVDVRRENDVRRCMNETAARFRRIDVLVNNAGIETSASPVEFAVEGWEDLMNVNLRGPWLCAKHAFPFMRAHGGSIISIGSTHPSRTVPGFLPYTVSKGGLQAMTASLAVDFGPYGIRANIICPGLIETPLAQEYLTRLRKSPEQYARLLEAQPLRRLGTADDVANAALFLASDESAFISGSVITVDGGRGVLRSIAGCDPESSLA